MSCKPFIQFICNVSNFVLLQLSPLLVFAELLLYLQVCLLTPFVLQLAAASFVLPHWTPHHIATPCMLLVDLWFLSNAWQLQVLIWQLGVSGAVHYML